MIKVLFIYQDEKMPSSRIRILNLLPELQKEGIFTYTDRYPKSSAEKIRLLKKFKQFDVVYLQKKLLSPPEAILFRRYSKRLIFDFDDAIYYRDDTHDSLKSKTRLLKFKYLVQNANLIVAGNKVLYDFACRLNNNIIIVPSAVETRDIPLKDYKRDNNDLIIGWVGGKGNLHHLKMLSSVFQRLSKDYNIQINILSNGSIEIPGVKVKHISWKLESQEKEIALFDIGVMPLPSNKWTEGKCGYKALQYMAAEVTPVVSDVGINSDIVEHGKEGCVVSTIEGFCDSLKTFIKDKELRKEMGFNARKKVENQYSVSVVGKKLADVLKQCC